jgi:hypothetical protein
LHGADAQRHIERQHGAERVPAEPSYLTDVVFLIEAEAFFE